MDQFLSGLQFLGSLLLIATIAYYGWILVIDRKAPSKGNRRSSWICSWKLWAKIGQLFPVRFSVQSPDAFSSKQSYVFCVHPHGILSFGALCTFIPEHFGMRKELPEVDCRICTLKLAFRIPFLRELILRLGFVEVSKESLRNIASHSKHHARARSAMIVVGGAEESLFAYPGSTDLVLQKRKGFVKQALENGMELVPVYLFGETELYYSVQHPLLLKLQRKIQKILSFSTPIIFGKYLTLIPDFHPLHVVVGEPVKVPSMSDDRSFQDQVNAYHECYVAALKKLFEDNVDKYGTPREKKQGCIHLVK